MIASVRPKRVLAICYSQTGQLARIAKQILVPLQENPGVDVHLEMLRPLPAYPFPWPFFQFFDAFPESAHLIAPKLEPLALTGEEDFDLIILFYQVWFLAPSLPVTAFLRHPLAARLLKNKPVVTVIACRNMWLMAHEKMKSMLASLGGRLIDNVVLSDRGNVFATLITTPLWFLTGRQTGCFGLPPPGIAPSEILQAQRFGLALLGALADDAEKNNTPLLAGLKAVEANPKLYFTEKAAARSFYLWGKLIRAAGKPGQWIRKPILFLYVIFLFTLIVTVIPVSLTLQASIRPLLRKKLARMKHDFELPSGCGTERMSNYVI
ncbi:MAG TPA: dialkylresorcinol condensing enzyme [Gallionellaceae bacterium]|nr:dialkylresorcinol condensing enzyme [Gallionellaceae bacterium]